MQIELSLTFGNMQGQPREVKISSKRFTIGSSPSNDLVIDHPRVSARHAVIESFDGTPRLTDSGSSNGTFVNNSRIVQAVRLNDRDVISLGSPDCRLTVHLTSAGKTTPGHNAVVRHRSPTSASKSTSGSPPSWLKTPVIAGVSISLFLIGFLIYKGINRNNHKNGPVTPAPSIPRSVPTVTPPPSSSPYDPLRAIEDEAKQVIKRLGPDDLSYVFEDRQQLEEIKVRIDEYRQQQPHVEAVLNTMKSPSAAITQNARSNRLAPGLVILTTMVEAVQKRALGQPVNPVAIASQAQDDIIWHRTKVGYDNADSTLLAIASYGLGRNTEKQRSLGRILESGKLTDVNRQRNIWYMYRNQMLDQQGYEFALRLLAIGVIAQNPRWYQIDTDSIWF